MGWPLIAAAVGVGALFGSSKSKSGSGSSSDDHRLPPLNNAISTVYNNILKIKSTGTSNQYRYVPKYNPNTGQWEKTFPELKARLFRGTGMHTWDVGGYYDIATDSQTVVERMPGTPEEERERDWLAKMAANSLHKVVQLCSTAGDKIGQYGLELAREMGKIDDKSIEALKKAVGGDVVKGWEDDLKFVRDYSTSKFNQMMRRYEESMERELSLKGVSASSEANEQRRQFLIDKAAALEEFTFRQIQNEREIVQGRLEDRYNRFLLDEKGRDIERNKLKTDYMAKVESETLPIDYATKTYAAASKPFEDEKRYALMSNPGAQVIADKNQALALANQQTALAAHQELANRQLKLQEEALHPQKAGFLEQIGNNAISAFGKGISGRIDEAINGRPDGRGGRVGGYMAEAEDWMNNLFKRRK